MSAVVSAVAARSKSKTIRPKVEVTPPPAPSAEAPLQAQRPVEIDRTFESLMRSPEETKRLAARALQNAYPHQQPPPEPIYFIDTMPAAHGYPANAWAVTWNVRNQRDLSHDDVKNLPANMLKQGVECGTRQQAEACQLELKVREHTTSPPSNDGASTGPVLILTVLAMLVGAAAGYVLALAHFRGVF